MGNYPKNQEQLEALIANEESCREFLERIRWPNGFVCPACGGAEAWRIANGRQECRACGRQTSVTAGTIFQDTRYPLRTWFQAIWHVVGQKQGASALGLQRVLGLGSYHTAWAWLHRLRRAMVCPGRNRLDGTVQVDETFWGSPKPGKHGRGAAGKSLIFVAVEHTGNVPGRIRLQLIPNASGEVLIRTAENTIESGSEVETDGWSGYNGLTQAGFRHMVVRPEAINELLPQVHLVVSLLKRWLLGTHQGAVRQSHLEYYLDEFTFRFNRRTAKSRGLLFRRILENAVQIPPVSGADLRA